MDNHASIVEREGVAAAERFGLLDVDETAAVLRDVLQDTVPEERLLAAAAALKGAEATRWEQMPPDIHPDVGLHYGFLPCTETCWLGREILIEKSIFRVYRLRA